MARIERRPQGQQRPSSEPSGGLVETIEREIIPRLVLAHRPIGEEVCAGARLPPTPEEIVAFAKVAMTQDLDAALAQVDALAQAGLGLESILMDLVAPTARVLGEQWDEDLITFVQVTAGLGLLQKLVHVLGPSFAPDSAHRGLCVLVAAPREQHTLGLYLVGEFLRRAGWGLELMPDLPEEGLLDLVSSTYVEMVGFTVSVVEHLPELGRTIAAVRDCSQNRDLPVMVGGAIDLTEFARIHSIELVASPRLVVAWLENWTRRKSNTRRLT